MRIPVNEPYTISSKFGVPDSRAKFGRHAGIDYAVPTGRRIYAPVSGTVTDYVWGQYHGHTVQIKDDKGNYHRLMHCSKLLVTPDQRVNGGEVVALSGATGEGITGPHVHWDISPQKVPTSFNFINPKTYEGEDMFNGKTAHEWFSIALKHDATIKNYQANYAPKTEVTKYRDAWKKESGKRAELTKIVTIKDNEITRLNALVGETTKWQTLRTLLRELLGIN